MSGKYLLDTNIVVALWRGENPVVDGVKRAQRAYIPTIVLGELLYGAYHSDRLEEDLARINRQMSRSELLVCDEVVADFYAQVKATLRKKGRPIPENDIWIAAVALRHRLTLVSRDSHFNEVDNLLVETW